MSVDITKTMNRPLARTRADAEVALAKAHLFAAAPEDLRDRSFGIALINPTAKITRVVLEYMRNAEYYREWQDEKNNKLFAALFGLEPFQLRQFSAAHSKAYNWKTAFFFVNMLPVANTSQVSRWLDCYIASFDAPNEKAYCCDVINADGLSVLCPCRYVGYHSINSAHPSPILDQYYASAVRFGFHQCPRFNMGNFKPLKQKKSWW